MADRPKFLKQIRDDANWYFLEKRGCSNLGMAWLTLTNRLCTKDKDPH